MRPRYGKVRKHCGPREIKKAQRFAAEMRAIGRLPILLEVPYNIGSSPIARRIMDVWLCEGRLVEGDRARGRLHVLIHPVRRIGRDVRRFVDLVRVKGTWGLTQIENAHRCMVKPTRYRGHDMEPPPVDVRLWCGRKPFFLSANPEHHPEIGDVFRALGRLGGKVSDL